MMRLQKEEEEKRRDAEEEAAAEEEVEEEPLERRHREERGESSSTKGEDAWMEKKISEWVANLSLGEDEEALLYVPQEEREAFARELEAMEDPLDRHTAEDEKRSEWKLWLAREKKRRREEANRMAREVEKVRACRQEVQAQAETPAKLDKILGYLEVLSKAWLEEHQANKGQDVTLHAIRSGFREFVRDVVTHVGTEVKKLKEGTKKFCAGAIEGAKVVATAEAESRPRKEPVKLKFPDSYSGKKDDSFDNWEASINTYVYLEHIAPEEQVLVAFHALKDEAASFARSLARSADCENNMVAYSKLTPLSTFLKLLRERFADVTRGVRASDKLQTIHSRQERSARALKAVMDDLVAVPDHGVTETQFVQLFYRAMPEPLRGHFFDKTQQANITYDALSREVVLFEAKSMPVSTFWHKDLDKGKKWKGRTISSQEVDMSGGDSRHDRDDRRDRSYDGGWRGRPESSRERPREVDRDHRAYRPELAGNEPPRRPSPICYGCKVPGHYRSDCWRFGADSLSRRQAESDGYVCPPEFDRRGRSVSPRRATGTGIRRSPSIDSQTSSRLAELGQSIATLHEFVDLEMARRSEKEKKRHDKEEARLREEEERKAEAAKAGKKVEKLRKREEEQLELTKAVEMQLALRIGNIRDDLRNEIRRVVGEVEKGKAKVVEQLSSTSGSGAGNNDVEVITEGTERLAISEKRKRGEETPVGNNPHVTTPAKRANKRTTVRPLRFSERLQRTRTRIAKKGGRALNKAQTVIKPPARDMAMERMIYLDRTRRELALCNCDQLRVFCREVGVGFVAKVQAIFDIADARARVRFDEGKREVGEDEAWDDNAYRKPLYGDRFLEVSYIYSGGRGRIEILIGATGNIILAEELYLRSIADEEMARCMAYIFKIDPAAPLDISYVVLESIATRVLNDEARDLEKTLLRDAGILRPLPDALNRPYRAPAGHVRFEYERDIAEELNLAFGRHELIGDFNDDMLDWFFGVCRRDGQLINRRCNSEFEESKEE
ncbi:hypothetical protein CBR_g37328 [Chara braunii]|uniref:CCHC-type domain-containing protein n=1 Tax=Chara braunii TaxID=69332 RepID=A0A388JZW8_CHABU|nr:hypothetical protein CBR_g37328 [Chara braunii]|eukprot:GBG63243.1 hypothetical protein CBR_g37328 [Chara braunii]